jgi:hypothetical protein
MGIFFTSDGKIQDALSIDDSHLAFREYPDRDPKACLRAAFLPHRESHHLLRNGAVNAALILVRVQTCFVPLLFALLGFKRSLYK